MSNIKPIAEYDANGNLIHYRDNKGFEYWREYDTNGNCIYYRDSEGYEYWREYDTNGNCIYYRDSEGYEEWWEYDTNGKLIHFRDNNGSKVWYDSKGKEHYNEAVCIHKNATISIIDDVKAMNIEELNKLKEWINKEFK